MCLKNKTEKKNTSAVDVLRQNIVRGNMQKSFDTVWRNIQTKCFVKKHYNLLSTEDLNLLSLALIFTPYCKNIVEVILSYEILGICFSVCLIWWIVYDVDYNHNDLLFNGSQVYKVSSLGREIKIVFASI